VIVCRNGSLQRTRLLDLVPCPHCGIAARIHRRALSCQPQRSLRGHLRKADRPDARSAIGGRNSDLAGARAADHCGNSRNPLVSPDILGASSGAALGAVLGIFASLGAFAIQALAFAGGLVAVALVYAVGSAVRARDPVLVLVLAGVVIGALLGAGVGLIKYLADPYNQLPAMTFWLLGSLAATGPSDLIPLFGPVALGTVALLALRWRMNVMSLPDEEARALGVPTGSLRIVIVAAATLVTSASVATAGIIGWVGLVVPHIARTLVGPDFGRLIPAAALIGGGFLLLIDTLARSAAAVEIPLGILTALVGTPFFIWLLASVAKTWSVE